MADSEIVNVRYLVDDVDVSLDFYTRHFGFTVGISSPAFADATRGNLRLLLSGPLSSAGRAILAQYSPEERQAIYRKIRFEPFSATTPMNAERIEADLRDAAARGYHQSSSEFIPDLAGVALPLPIGPRRLSIVVAGPTSRCLERRPQTAVTMIEIIRRMLPEAAGKIFEESAR